jgi:hypothetical protein
MLTNPLGNQLTISRIFNIWCHHLAAEEWKSGMIPIEDRDVTPDERWSLYSNYPHLHKVTGKLTDDIYATLGYQTLANNISTKHHITVAKLQRINTLAMLRFIDCQKVTQRSSIIKMIHGWEPTYGCLCRQGRESSPLCPQCYQTVETSAHYRTCTADQATEARINFLGDILIEME